MRKIFFSLALVSGLLLAAALSGCGSSTPLPVTSKVAFIRNTGLPTLASQKSHRAPLTVAERRVQMRARVQQPRITRLRSTAAAVIPSGDRSVYLINVDGTGETLIGATGYFDFVQLRADGSQAVFSAEDTDGYAQIYMVSMSDPTNPTQLTSDAEDHYEPQLSADGSTIVFVKYNSETDFDELWTISSSGGTETQIETTGYDVWAPTWTPDGTKIVFEGWTEGDYDYRIYSINAEGGTPTPLTENLSGEDVYPAVSPDGETIVFQRWNDNTGTSDIFTVAITGEILDGSTPAQQLTTDGYSGDPLYVGSSKIVYISWQDTATDTSGDCDVWAMNVNGSGQAPLTTDTNEDFFSYHWW
jgi:Tol biopolymer transport system component